MTTKKVVETSVTVNNNRTIQDYVHPDDQTQPILTQPRYITETLYLTKIIFVSLRTSPDKIRAT